MGIKIIVSLWNLAISSATVLDAGIVTSRLCENLRDDIARRYQNGLNEVIFSYLDENLGEVWMFQMTQTLLYYFAAPEGAISVVRVCQSLWYLAGGSAAVLRIHLSNFKAIWTPWHQSFGFNTLWDLTLSPRFFVIWCSKAWNDFTHNPQNTSARMTAKHRATRILGAEMFVNRVHLWQEFSKWFDN